MQIISQAHIPDDALEEYILERTPENEIAAIETHILACESCTLRLETMDEEVAAMKMGLRAVQLEHAVPNVEWPGRWFGLALPRLSYVAFVPCVAICLLLPLRVRQETGTPRVVMHADRGSDLEAVPRDSDINLIADAVDLSPGPVIVQVFDAQGAEVWKGKTLVQEDVAQIVLPPFRRGGWYILELGKRAANSRSELLREFVFYVR